MPVSVGFEIVLGKALIVANTQSTRYAYVAGSGYSLSKIKNEA